VKRWCPHLSINHICVTCAPWRTRMSTPLLSMEIRAASSTSVSEASSSLSGLENLKFSSYRNPRGKHFKPRFEYQKVVYTSIVYQAEINGKFDQKR
jgi:hypothetical protein